eukprot:TRINITY_DN7757_c0_g1_i1.p1 TRINITY_DN7757_c0_g1~~TRINITY_DN7757_c0_g1_i1.p1  ORF type:complete len:275 (-),score=46.37 TRINITY_DN7757_c0_g1_i1:30-854(-)
MCIRDRYNWSNTDLFDFPQLTVLSMEVPTPRIARTIQIEWRAHKLRICEVDLAYGYEPEQIENRQHPFNEVPSTYEPYWDKIQPEPSEPVYAVFEIPPKLLLHMKKLQWPQNTIYECGGAIYGDDPLRHLGPREPWYENPATDNYIYNKTWEEAGEAQTLALPKHQRTYLYEHERFEDKHQPAPYDNLGEFDSAPDFFRKMKSLGKVMPDMMKVLALFEEKDQDAFLKLLREKDINNLLPDEADLLQRVWTRVTYFLASKAKRFTHRKLRSRFT